MKPHRPIDLDAFDESFFSKEKVEDKSKVFTDINSENTATPPKATASREGMQNNVFASSLDSEIIEALMNMKPSADNPVFHDIPDIEPDGKSDLGTEELVTQEEALKSFPDFEFDPSKFEIPEDERRAFEDEEEMKSSQILKEHKKRAKQELKEKEASIKAQKKLEQQVQKPFRIRRICRLLFALFIIAGVLMTAFSAVIYKTGVTPDTALNAGDYSLFYVNGTDVKSDEINNSLVFLKREKVITSTQILFTLNGEYRVENVLAIGSDICAVAITQKVIPIPTEDIIGDVRFKIDRIKPIYEMIHSQSITCAVGIAVYFALIIILFTPLIQKQNKKIKEYKQEYQLIG